jgi:hypothetical protein
MRILHLDAGRELRGGQWQVLRLIAGLSDAGIECTLLARPGSPLFAAATAQGRRVQALGLIRAAMLARRHDLVHAHDARSHTIGALVRGERLVVSRRVAFAIGSPWKYRRAAHYLAVSEFVKGVLMRGGVAENKISVVYDGVPLLNQAHGVRVLAPATSDPAKGASLAVSAAKLAGVDLKFSSNLEDDLRDAAAFVYITHSEGLGSGVLLAMSAGVPVVASKVGGLSEIIRHGENGLLVENTPAAISAAMRELLDQPDLARRLGEAARQTVAERFTVDRMVRRTIEVYRQVLS